MTELGVQDVRERVTRMLDEVTRRLQEGEGAATLIGSSLGGALAVLAAAHLPRLVDRVILLAPAVMFAKPGHHLLPPERIEEWRVAGSMSFFSSKTTEPPCGLRSSRLTLSDRAISLSRAMRIRFCVTGGRTPKRSIISALRSSSAESSAAAAICL